MGQDGNDILSGGDGHDRVYGYEGNDTLLFDSDKFPVGFTGQDLIDLYATNSGGNTYISIPSFGVITIIGIADRNDLANDIDFF